MRKLILLGVLVASSAFAGVEVRDGKMSADITGQPLKQVLQTIKQNTGIRFSMDDSVSAQAISANFQDLTVAAGIKKMLEGTGINYVVMADGKGEPTSIFLGKSEKPGAPPKKLDTRPVANIPNRGVVQPIQPVQPIQQPNPQMNQQRKQQQQERQAAIENKPAGMSNTVIEVPTAGSFVSPSPQVQPNVNQSDRPNPDEEAENGDDDEDEE
jgi:hypothetical protein